MERTKKAPVNNKAPAALVAMKKVQVYEEILGRANLISRFGKQYDDARDLYEALGYSKTLTYDNYLARYERQDIAKAIIDRPANATWQGVMRLVDSSDEKETALQSEWTELSKQFSLKKTFSRLDKLSSIGEYGVLLLGVDDIISRNQFVKPISKRKNKLLYLKPFGQDRAKIEKYVGVANDPRYGLPEYYKVVIQIADEERTEEVRVHHSRIIHVIGDSLESDVKGTPRLQAVYNRLMDLEKIVGGDAEMFWRGARPGYQGKVDPDFQLTTEMEADLKAQIDEFEHNLRRILVNEGIDIQALAQQIAEPGNHVDVQIQMISAVTGIPKRILTGSERGELSSAQDASEYLSFVTARREEFAEPNIVKPFVDRCIEYGILPSAQDEEYDIVWGDLFVLNEKEQVELGQKRAMALREYSQNPMAETIVPPEMFLKYMLGLKPHEIDEFLKALETMARKEPRVTPQEEQIISEEQLAVTANNE